MKTFSIAVTIALWAAVASAVEPPSLTDLDSIDVLQATFNEDREKTRILLLLSPT